MTVNFDKHTQKAHQFLSELRAELYSDDEAHANRVLKSVFYTLRESLLPQESLDLVAQLPMYLKAVYVDGWKIADSPRRTRNLEEFIAKTVNHDPNPASRARDFGESDAEAAETIKAVFRVLNRHITEGQYEHVEAELPKDVKALMREAEFEEGVA